MRKKASSVPYVLQRRVTTILRRTRPNIDDMFGAVVALFLYLQRIGAPRELVTAVNARLNTATRRLYKLGSLVKVEKTRGTEAARRAFNYAINHPS